MITHVLDSSAILAHYLGENGAEEVTTYLLSGAEIGVSVVSLVELRTRFRELCKDRRHGEQAFALYCDELCTVLDVNRAVVDAANHLRSIASGRLPAIDSIIAATAKLNGAALVHRDPHFTTIPSNELSQISLPAK